MTELPATYGRGVRTPYAAQPAPVRAWVEAQLGGGVQTVQDRVGGFSPGTAAVLHGRRSGFVKIVSDDPNPKSLELYRGERERLAALPDHPGIVKPLAATDLEVGGRTYAVTLFPALPGRPPQHPWSTDELARVLAAVTDLGEVLAAADGSGLPDAGHLVEFFSRWPAVLTDADDPWASDPWVRDHADLLRGADATIAAEAPGEVPAHTDLRADNLVIDGDRVHVVDWAAARRAAPWVDLAILGCDLVVGGLADPGRDAWEVPTGVPFRQRWATVASLAAALHRASRAPDPPGLPTIRGWQALSADRLLAAARSADLGALTAP